MFQKVEKHRIGTGINKSCQIQLFNLNSVGNTGVEYKILCQKGDVEFIKYDESKNNGTLVFIKECW